MEMKFSLEVAGLLISFIIFFACHRRYNMIDLKDELYLKTVHFLSSVLFCNVLINMLIYLKVINFSFLYELLLYGNIIFISLIWYYLNNYLYEYIYHTNYISRNRKIIFLLPVVVNLIFLCINIYAHTFFDLKESESKIQLVCSTSFRILYIMIFIQILLYICLLCKNKSEILKNKLYIFYIIPVLMVSAYILQIIYFDVFILGFVHSLVLLLFYIFSYNAKVKIDNLTKLPNDDSFKNMLDYRIALHTNMKVVMLTLNNFKSVNYEYGYHNGNKFIQIIAKFLEENATKNAIARYGGDKYTFIFEDFTDEAFIDWCQKMMDRFEHSWIVNQLTHKISVCITSVDVPEYAKDSSEVLELLEYLNVEAKKYKKNRYILCDSKTKEQLQRRKQINILLNDLIEKENLHAVFQPILDVSKNRYTRAEALIYIEDSNLGIIDKEEFMPIAEENGYMNNLGYVLLKRVCKYIQSFLEEGNYPPLISVNFTRQQIMSDDVIERIFCVLNEYELKPNCFAIELSENIFSTQYEEVKSKLLEMSKQGFRFYLDGFGMGILELSHLLELPFEIVKINKNLIKEAEENNSIYLLLSALVAVFEENGKKILGEGIDTVNQKEITDLLFMNYLQGDYYCKAVPSNEANLEFAKDNIDDKIRDYNQL